MKCVCTGIALINEEGEHVACDMWDTGGNWLLVGNVNEYGQPNWLQGEPHYCRTLTPTDYFERRGVFVVEYHHANLNQEAREYIGEDCK